MKEDRIGVFVRVRPYQDRQAPSTFILSMNEQQITVRDKQRDKEQDLNFAFDHIFQVKSTQREVYEKVGQPIVDAAFEGINGTMFAYGQTSSGKTYTCVGPDCDDPEDKGLLPRSVQAIFDKIAGSPHYIQFRIKVSMVEIYLQKIRDLLDTSKNDLKIRENKSKGIYIQDVTEEYVSSTDEAMKVFKKGVNNRVVCSTNMNDVSSRSHMAFILTLHQNNLRDGSAKSGKITVVDLAGSQKVSKTHAEGKVLDEAKTINKSLSSLGNVINALTDFKINHVPYRDSKLTRLLQESLGGNSKTSLMINISPSSYNGSESVSSLRFGFRAKQIKNKPKINKEYTISELLVLLQKSEKRNQQLQILLKQLTASKKFKKKQGFVENLLDSDNPIMSALSDNEQEKIMTTNRSALKTIRKCYESQMGSDDQSDKQKIKVEETKLKEQAELQELFNNKMLEKQEELSILRQELMRVSDERVGLVRELDICKERLDCVIKQAKLNLLKLNAEKRDAEQLLQRYIKQNLENQQKDSVIDNLQSKISRFEEKIVKLSQIHKQQTKKSNVFGLTSQLNNQTSKILEQAMHQNEDNEQLKAQAQKSLQKDRLITQLNFKIKQMEHQMSLYKHLQKAKEDLIKQKLKFVEQRDRIYRDLENRIEKVLELEEKLDEEKERNNFLTDVVTSDQNEKGRKILSLQAHINEISENYYVLKGQQSSWVKNNKKIEDKLQSQSRKITSLEGDNIELRAQIESLRMRCEQLEAFNDNNSVLDIELQDNQQDFGTGNIVKVVKSYISNINN